MSALALHARLTPGHDERIAHAVAMLQSADAEHRGSIVLATSLGVEDMVLADMVSRHRLDIAVATLETGMLHAETLALMATLESRYGIALEVHRPSQDAVIAFVGRHGAWPMFESVALRKRCCAIRKLEPLERLLDGRQAWITGLRRGQSTERAEVAFREVDGNGRIKLSPLADWSLADVWHYVATHAVAYNPLHDRFYPSIGCAPCTRAVALGEEVRAGRWWWEIESAKECGLHAPVHGLEGSPA